MKIRTGITWVMCILLSTVLVAGPGGQKKKKGGNGGSGGGGANPSGLLTTIAYVCGSSNCDVVSDGGGDYLDSELPDGDAGITLEFGRGDYKATLRSSSAREATVYIESAACGLSGMDGWRLRFLRIDDVEGLDDGASMLTNAYAQIDGPGSGSNPILIWNLFWSSDGVQTNRSGNAWDATTTSTHTVVVQEPGKGKKWVTCDENAQIHFDVQIVQP